MLGRLLALLFAGIGSLYLGFAAQVAHAQLPTFPAIPLNSDHPIALNKTFKVFVESEGKLTAEDIVQNHLSQFQSAQELSLQPGYTSKRYWLLTYIQNTSATTEWFILPDSPLVEFEAYVIGPDSSMKKSSLLRSETRFPVRKIAIPSGERHQVLLEVWSPLALNLSFQFMTDDQLRESLTEENTMMGIITGVFLAMIIYNIFLYATLRDQDYLYYLLFIIVNTHLNLLGLDYPQGVYRWLDWNWLAIIDVYRPLAPLTTLLFARSFLQTKKKHPTVDRWILGYILGLLGLMAAALFVPRHILFPIEDSYFILAILLLIIAGVQSLRRGFRPSHFYLFGLSFFVSGIAIYIFTCEGILPANAFTSNALIIFQAMEMLLMSLALSGKIKQLEAHKTQAEVSVSAKSRLLRVISHDIANPLSIVKGMAYLLRHEVAEEARVDAISRAVSVIEEIMNFVHKNESLDSIAPIETHDVSLAEVFDGLQFVFHRLAGDKGIRLIFELDQPDLVVRAEKTSLTYEVLGNFLGNAIKFTEPGGEIRVRAVMVNQRMQITIQDDGIGMSARVVAAAFDPMINVSRRGTAGEKGGGYGLLLAKAYLEQFGAAVMVESNSRLENSERSGTLITLTFQSSNPRVKSRSLRQRWRLIP